ncbi:18S rRNA (guanine-N(7))-methyltransferase bud23, partial [Neolecta irregularis DAH-3]
GNGIHSFSRNSIHKKTLRALELLQLDPESSCFILDIGCGSGLSGEILEQEGHTWVGMDISPSMLGVAVERDTEGDLLLSDIGAGIPFRPGSFDAAISISVLQWLGNADKSTNRPVTRLTWFFESLYTSLKKNGRAVLQFYPENDEQCAWIMSLAKKAGFGGGLVVDNSKSVKKKKVYLVLVAGSTSLPLNVKSKNVKETGKDWILRKKQLYRKRGKVGVPKDSKYTGRKRRPKF